MLVNNYLSGRRFIKDLVHFLKLRKKPLTELDNAWANAKDRSDIVVSFTTIPDRISLSELMIKSVLHQKRLPKKIILNLPYVSFRDGKEYVIPEWLNNLQSVEIVRTEEDHGPATKFIPSLLSLGEDENILVLDDDHVYPPNYIAEFEAGEKMYPDYILTASGWRVPDDLIDKPTSLISNIMKLPPTPVKGTRIKKLYPTDIVQGYAGYLIKPRFFDLSELTDYSDAPEIVRYVDDVWVSAHGKAKKFVLPMKRYCYSPLLNRKLFKSTSLAMINNRGKAKNEDRHNSIALRYFSDRWKK